MTRIHVVSLPHTLLTKDYDWCAYTAKVRRFVVMLHRAGAQALVYGPDVHDVPDATDYVPVVHESDRVAWFGSSEWDRNRVFDQWDADAACWTVMNERAAAAIRERWEPGDLLGVIGGMCQYSLVAELDDLAPLVVEWGIGYSGIIPGSHRVFESYAWMHHVAGFYREDDIRFFDTVIPNCFDDSDFLASYVPGDYLLFIGRPNPRKGLAIVEELAQRSGLPVLVAGQPGADLKGCEYVGVVTGQEKADLIAGARALVCPTTYLEPFGGVAVEAQLSGTPVIATDYGAFTETVTQGVSGYRCRMLGEFLQAVEACADLDRRVIHEQARARYTLEPGARMYGDYLRRVETLYGEGWYTPGVPFAVPGAEIRSTPDVQQRRSKVSRLARLYR